jgi:DNA (cytosine-5)-methyltransferase 1
MLCPLRYAAKHRPEMVVVENVVEAAKWGPMRDGSTFRWWLREWEKIGYEHECLFLNSMFFPPCPQSRDRMYVVLWRKGNTKPDLDHRPTALCTSDRCSGSVVQAVQSWKKPTKAWPLPRWGKYGAQYVYRCPDCRSTVVPVAWPAYSAIDWSKLGPTMAERRDLGMTLATSTMERVRRGLAKFKDGPPILIPARGVGWGADRPVTEPMTTLTTVHEQALVVPLRTHHEARHPTEQLPTVVAGNVGMGIVVPVNGNDHERPGQTRARPLDEPMFTLTGTQAWGFAIPFVAEMRGGGSNERSVVDPLASVVAGGFHHGLTSPALFQKINGAPGDTAWHHMGEPLNAVTPTGDPITDEDMDRVRFRMLEPDPELRRAMSFGDDYILLGNKTQRTSGLGNAVTPPVASWITERCLATLRGGLAAA